MSFMNKVALISDIHGNFEALKTVLGEIDRLGISDIYCTGDVVGYYSQINECCDLLREREIPCLMGNHDWYMAGRGFCPRSRSVNDCLEYQRTKISTVNLRWLQTLPVFLDVGDLRMVHGGWGDPIDEYLKPSAEYFAKIPGKYFVSGHTHIQCVHDYGEKVYCNPGSVGQPRDGDPRSAFAVFQSGEFELHRVAYDMQKVFDLMDEAGFNDYYYGGLATGSKNLRKL
jgi:predicted phosphodiesterase